MPQFLRPFFIYLTILCLGLPGVTNGQPPVKWEFRSKPASANEAVISISASISEGWHLYSQHLAEGGPQPTQILFDSHSGFDLVGTPRESGMHQSFYDSLYEMKITWYTRSAVFEQKVLLREAKATATGRVEYMVCNDYVCVPATQEFSVILNGTK